MSVNTFRLSSPFSPIQHDDNSSGNLFAGIAYTGDEVSQRGTRYVFDLSNLTHNDKLPALVNHDPDQRAGVINQISADNQIKIQGKYLDSDSGKSVMSESGEGFPWQLSIGIEPRSYEEIASGTVIVNGRTFNAPIIVCRNNKLVEVSFVPVGADTNTSAFNLSGLEKIPAASTTVGKKMSENQDNANAAEVEKLRLRIAELENSNAALLKSQRESSIAELQKTLPFELSANQKAHLLSVDEAGFKMTAELITQSAQKMQQANNLTHELSFDNSRGNNNGGDGYQVGSILLRGGK